MAQEAKARGEGRIDKHKRKAVGESEELNARLRSEAKRAVDRADSVAEVKATKHRPKKGPAARERTPLPGRPHKQKDEAAALRAVLGEHGAEKARKTLRSAADSYLADRTKEARNKLRPLAEAAPNVVEVRELYGLALYREGAWAAAVEQLEAFREITGSTEQHPVLADCHRALGRWADVAELWDELREASPDGALVAEGRIVAANALADQGDLSGAVRLIEKSWRTPKQPKEHHLRRAYAIGDLRERAGDLPQARSNFAWVLRQDAAFGDVKQRLAALD